MRFNLGLKVHNRLLVPEINSNFVSSIHSSMPTGLSNIVSKNVLPLTNLENWLHGDKKIPIIFVCVIRLVSVGTRTRGRDTKISVTMLIYTESFLLQVQTLLARSLNSNRVLSPVEF